MTNFDEKVYQIVKKIPKGKVSTYSQIAKLIGRPKDTRPVGQALKRNPKPIIVPCHRVVTSNGNLGGFALGMAKKRELLLAEGVEIYANKIDLEKFGWKKL